MTETADGYPKPMTHEFGHRIGVTAKLSIGAAVAVAKQNRLLLTRRSDSGEWCMPGGGMDAGERPAETAEREVLEETGLVVRVTKLLGVYCNPDIVVVYPDGNRAQIVGVLFRAEPNCGHSRAIKRGHRRGLVHGRASLPPGADRQPQAVAPNRLRH